MHHREGHTGYTCGVKTAVSIPDEIYREADRAAEQLGWSRSQLYARALREFLEHQGDDPVTVALDALADEVDGQRLPNQGRALIDSGAWEW